MTRSLTMSIATEIQKGTIRPVSFLSVEFSSETRYIWSGLGDFVWNSITWTGVGELLQITPATEVADIRAMNFTATLSGVISEYVALILEALQQGKKVKWYLGFLASDGTLVDDPVLCFAGYVDYAEFSIGPDTSTITLSAESRLADLTKTFTRRYTAEDQHIDYPTDTGFNWVNAIQSMTLAWGGGPFGQKRPTSLLANPPPVYNEFDGNNAGP